MQSSNPVLTRYEKNDKSGYAYAEGVNAYTQAAAGGAGAADVNTAFQQVTAGGGARLTMNDVIVKCLAVFAVTVVFAVLGWNLVDSMPWVMWVGLLGGLGLGLVNAFKKVPSPPLILLYAVFQGVFLGGISNFYNTLALSNEYQGIVLQAVIATMTTFGVMLTLYLTGIIKVTKKFQSVMMVAVVSYMVLGLASLVAALFGVGGGWGFYGIDGIGLIICV
ncbi:MAG: Bax inhibitor-1/YccA family protein, partial [bacterium]|nr:Bax inhibitor-1/YccA family protein [bacterium]